jgi:hypothetical protein
VAHYDGAHRLAWHRFNAGFGMVIRLNVKHVNSEFFCLKRVPLFTSKKFIYGNKICSFVSYKGSAMNYYNEFSKKIDIDAWVIILKTHKDEHIINFDLEGLLPPSPVLNVDSGRMESLIALPHTDHLCLVDLWKFVKCPTCRADTLNFRQKVDLVNCLESSSFLMKRAKDQNTKEVENIIAEVAKFNIYIA